MIKDTTVKVSLEKIIIAWATAVGWNAAASSWIVLFITVFKDVKIFTTRSTLFPTAFTAIIKENSFVTNKRIIKLGNKGKNMRERMSKVERKK